MRESRRKLPGANEGHAVVPAAAPGWYFTRIWIEVTPLRVTWWERGRLDEPPQVWTAPAGTAAPASDPAPAPAPPDDASGTSSWRTPSEDWRPAAARAERLAVPC